MYNYGLSLLSDTKLESNLFLQTCRIQMVKI